MPLFISNFLNFRSTFYSLLIVFSLFAGGCASIGKIANKPVEQLPGGDQRYDGKASGDTLLILAFSGGGTRAAALSYGVLEELRDTHYQTNGREIRLLDEVDEISSVSGGSFTSAYYGLFGDQIFDNYKDAFLYKDVQGELTGRVFGFFEFLGRMFTPISRTEVVINYYDKHIFLGKTFADLQAADGPLILINASDLNSQSQFVFVQNQFDFLCSDLSQIKVARAVAASSAVPVVFAPILFERHPDCNFQKPAWLIDAELRAKQEGDERLQENVDSFNFYLDQENPPYVTLQDGGITDNLGLRTIFRNIRLSGGAKKVHDRYNKGLLPPKRVVLIVVNASTSSETNIGKDRVLPGIGETLSVVTDIQLHLYNTETNTLFKEHMKQWAEAMSTIENPVTPYLIELDVTEIEEPEEKKFFNKIPTSFSLEKKQVDMLINTSKRLLQNHPEYQKLLHELGATSPNI